MAEILTDLSAPALVGAIKANLYAFFRRFSSSSVADTQEEAEHFRWRTSVAHPWFSGVFSRRPPTDSILATAHRNIDFFRPRVTAGFTWWFAPELDPVVWASELLPLGFHYEHQTPGMAIDLNTLSTGSVQGLSIQTVEDRAGLKEWVATFIRGYGLPGTMEASYFALVDSMGSDLPFQYYLGRLDGKPVAASTLFLGAGVAGIYNVATTPEARGRGIGSTMTLAPLFEARQRGYRAGVLQSSDIGYAVYERLGFRKLCHMDHFYWSGEKAQARG